MNTRAIIDYAIQDDASAMRDALYSEIQDRVHAHLEMKKQEIAGNLIAQEDAVDVSDESMEEPQE
jgi:hypothetical protein